MHSTQCIIIDKSIHHNNSRMILSTCRCFPNAQREVQFILKYFKLNQKLKTSLFSGRTRSDPDTSEIVQPRSTFFIFVATGSVSSSESDSVLENRLPGVLVHRGEQRYCSNGRRYFPQKSTNLMCSTRDVKQTPGKKAKNIHQFSLILVTSHKFS